MKFRWFDKRGILVSLVVLAVMCFGGAVFAGTLGERCGADSDCGPALFCGAKSKICVASSEADAREAKKLAAVEAAAKRAKAENEAAARRVAAESEAMARAKVVQDRALWVAVAIQVCREATLAYADPNGRGTKNAMDEACGRVVPAQTLLQEARGLAKASPAVKLKSREKLATAVGQ